MATMPDTLIDTESAMSDVGKAGPEKPKPIEAAHVPRRAMLDIVCDVLGFEYSPTLLGRFEMLCKMGFLPHNRNGRGKKALYTPDDALHVVIAFELMDVGMTPEAVIAAFGDGLASAIGESVEKGGDLALHPQRLRQFRVRGNETVPYIQVPVASRWLGLMVRWPS